MVYRAHPYGTNEPLEKIFLITRNFVKDSDMRSFCNTFNTCWIEQWLPTFFYSDPVFTNKKISEILQPKNNAVKITKLHR